VQLNAEIKSLQAENKKLTDRAQEDELSKQAYELQARFTLEKHKVHTEGEELLKQQQEALQVREVEGLK